ncbi:hypothetical protein SJ809_003859 [Salmonella enterica]|uniref:hypothetical protein n=1 Tax=Enterobacteriaceae TaxID=543 RepID=UPI0018EA2A20|nr:MULTISPECIES: hypothetical protein [Enterobacteriaceae]ELU3246161.1 hypothetical protein [Salmonella enterica]ELX6750900.1 hypothetical protein [Salmonella enterica]HCM3005443.1 hypothetical protein [Klebsiella pneumoniae]
MMTNEQAVIDAEAKIALLKQKYVSHMTPIVLRLQSKGADLSLSELLQCQQLGADYFNFVESFVGSSGLLGAHVNGKWVTGFAENCHSVLMAIIVHHNFLRSHSEVLGTSLNRPDENAYANMQRMTKEYLQNESWKKLEGLFAINNLPTSGFKYEGAKDLKETPRWQLVTGLCVGLVFSLIILALVVIIPNPTPVQIFTFRGLIAISLAAIAAIIPGLLNVETRFQRFSVRATGAIAVFVLIWLINPPSLLNS